MTDKRDAMEVVMEQDGATLIAAERARQVSVEGWTPEHDDKLADGALSAAASAYTLLTCDILAKSDFERCQQERLQRAWPWHESWWKPSPDPIRNLVKAGALIAAEIDRLQRGQERRLRAFVTPSLGYSRVIVPIVGANYRDVGGTPIILSR